MRAGKRKGMSEVDSLLIKLLRDGFLSVVSWDVKAMDGWKIDESV